MRSALRSSEITLPLRKIIINLAPADVRKTGSVYDLAVAVALLRMADLVDDSMLSTSAFIGELSLSGEIRPVQGVLPMTIISKEGRPFEASISTLTAKALSPSRPTLFITANTLTSLPYSLI